MIPTTNFNVDKRPAVSVSFRLPLTLESVKKEYLEAKKVENFRKFFKDLCRQQLNITAPNDSYTRWVFSQRFNGLQPGLDPFFPNIKAIVNENVIRDQLYDMIPSRLTMGWKEADADLIRKFYLKACSNFLYYADGNRKIVAKINKLKNIISNSTDQQAKNNSWKQELEILKNDMKDTLIMPYINTVLEDTYDYINKVQQKPLPNLQIDLSSLKYENEKIIFYDDVLDCSLGHFDKLQQLFTITNPDITNKSQLYIAIYLLFRRYATLFGDNEGVTFHAAAPPKSFQEMFYDFDVQMEMFGSPLNCHFSNYCSAFPDIDSWFGSCGTFQDFIKTPNLSGSFEAGPPYTIEVMDQAANLILETLENSSNPLSFIYFVPEWRDPLAHYHDILDNHKFNRSMVVLKGKDYHYVVGDQHRKGSKLFILPMNTVIYFLQNDAGAMMYPTTSEKIECFKLMFQKDN